MFLIGSFWQSEVFKSFCQNCEYLLLPIMAEKPSVCKSINIFASDVRWCRHVLAFNRLCSLPVSLIDWSIWHWFESSGSEVWRLWFLVRADSGVCFTTLALFVLLVLRVWVSSWDQKSYIKRLPPRSSCQPIHRTHESILCLKITRRRVDINRDSAVKSC